jgi:hypothetical protein
LVRLCGSVLDFVEKLEEFWVGMARIDVFVLNLVEALVKVWNTLVGPQKVVSWVQLSWLVAQQVVLHVVELFEERRVVAAFCNRLLPQLS